jgi:SAM-dependent methyltransferase
MAELRSNVEWKQWGKDDPLWAVSTWANKQKGGSSPWTEEEFFAVGESDWADFFPQWRQYGVGRESCLEVGCGAGRITKPLARAFDRVYAVDVSEDMIACARKAVGANVEFSVIDGLHLPRADGSVQAVFSTHVLQHLDSVEVGCAYFREFFRVLGAGGTMMVHLPLYQFPADGGVDLVLRPVYAVARQLIGLRANLMRAAGLKTMRGTRYPIRPLNAFLIDLGFRNIEFRFFPVKRDRSDVHPFVLATR